jgi:hypothetical protein
VCRFFSGLGGSCGLAVLGGVLYDIWNIKQRPKASGLVTLGPYVDYNVSRSDEFKLRDRLFLGSLVQLLDRHAVDGCHRMLLGAGLVGYRYVRILFEMTKALNTPHRL